MKIFYVLSLFFTMCSLAYGQEVYQVSFNDLEAEVNYIDSAAVGDVLFIEDSIEVSMVDITLSGAVSYLATTENQCTEFRTDNIHMFYAGGLEFNTTQVSEDINYVEFLYNWDCSDEPVELNIDGRGVVYVEDDDTELIIDNELYITRFEDFLAITGPVDVITVGALEMGIENVTFRSASEDCHLLNLESRNTCSGPDQQFFSELSFDYVAVESDSFNVYVNGDLNSVHAYADLPVQIGPFPGDNTTLYTYTVEDKFNSLCRDNVSIGAILCTADDCEISNASVDVGECTNGNNYPIRIDFDLLNPQGSFYDVNGSQGYIGFFRYDKRPETIFFPNSENDEEYVIVSDAKSPFCSDTVYFNRPNCPDEDNCVINTMDLSIINCLDTTFEVRVDLVTEGTSDYFDLAVGIGGFTEYEYDSLPIVIGPFPADSISNYSITVIDRDNAGCNVTRRIRPVACGRPRCNIRQMQLTTTECRGEFVDALLDFNPSAGTSDSFTLLINNFPQGNYPYTAIPIALEPLRGDGSSYLIGVRDINNECDNFWQTSSILCPPCDVSLAVVDPGECRSDRTIPITIDLDVTNVTSTEFNLITSTGLERTFQYRDLPVTILYPIDLDVDDDIIYVSDSDDPSCGDSFTLDLPDCRNEWCNITGMEVTQRPCSGNTYGVNLDFRFRNTGARFRVRGDAGTLGVFDYTDLPVAVGPFVSDAGRIYRLIVEDIADPEACRDTLDFESFTCVIIDVDEIEEYNVSIYPVPAHEQIFIHSRLDIDKIAVYNLQGQRVINRELNAQVISADGYSYTLDVHTLDPGVYAVDMISQNGERQQTRLVIH